MRFDLAILLFYFVSLILHKNYKPKQVLLSFIGWDSIGNSNWFVFSILVAYIIIYFAHFIFKNPKTLSFVSFILTVGFVVLMSYYKEAWWYNTILTLPIGMIYAAYKDKIEAKVLKNNLYYFLYLIVLIGIFIGLRYAYKAYNPYQLIYNLYSIVFALIVIALTYKVKISNKVLNFLGVYSFGIYILQRIPMIFLAKTSLLWMPVLYTFVCFVITIVIAYIFTKFCNVIDKILFKKSKN